MQRCSKMHCPFSVSQYYRYPTYCSCDFCVSNSSIIDLFLPCTIVTLVDNWLPSRLISSQLSRLRLLGISSERLGKYLVFSYSFESFFLLKVLLLVLSAFTFKNWRVFWVRFVLNGFNVSKCLSIHPYWFDAGQVPVIKNFCFFPALRLSDGETWVKLTQ